MSSIPLNECYVSAVDPFQDEICIGDTQRHSCVPGAVYGFKEASRMQPIPDIPVTSMDIQMSLHG